MLLAFRRVGVLWLSSLPIQVIYKGEQSKIHPVRDDTVDALVAARRERRRFILKKSKAGGDVRVLTAGKMPAAR